MGKMRINNTEIVAPADRMPVRDIKALAHVPANQRLYTKAGKILQDDEVVPTNDAEFGVVTSWENG